MNSINIHCFLAARASLCCRAGGNGLLETSHQTLDSGVTDSRVSVSAARTMAMVSVCCPVSLLTGMARRLYHLLAPSSPLGLIKSLVHTHTARQNNNLSTLIVVVVLVAFSSLARILGECPTIHSQRALVFSLFFVLFLFLLLEVEISSHILIPLLMTGSVHSGSESRDKCGRLFSDKLRVSSFPDRFPHYAWTAA